MNLLGAYRSPAGRITRAALLATALAASGAFARVALAQDVKAGDAEDVTLVKRVFKTGDINRYKIGIKASIGGMDQTVNMVFKETTKDAKSTGEFTLVNTFESASANDMDILQFVPTVTVMRDKAGKLSNKTEGGLDAVAGQISSMMQGLSTLQDVYVPKTHVKTGEKWEVMVTTPSQSPGGAESKTKGEATLVGTEVVGGVKSYKVKITADVDSKAQDVKAHTESVLNLDPTSGKLLKLVAKVDGTAAGMKMAQEMELNLMPAEKVAAATDK